MHRRGHVGMTLLAVAPIAYLCVSNGSPLLALVAWIGVQAVEPLPDRDLQIPSLRHRGLSHSLLTALVVGSVIGASGWVFADAVNDLLLALPGVLSTVLPQGELGATFLPDVLTNRLTLLTGLIETHALADSAIDRHGVALFGFGIGGYGIIAHLLGDIITIKGIQPFLPVSQRRVSISPLRAKSPMANTGVFVLGVGAMLGALVGAGL